MEYITSHLLEFLIFSYIISHLLILSSFSIAFSAFDRRNRKNGRTSDFCFTQSTIMSLRSLPSSTWKRLGFIFVLFILLLFCFSNFPWDFGSFWQLYYLGILVMYSSVDFSPLFILCYATYSGHLLLKEKRILHSSLHWQVHVNVISIEYSLICKSVNSRYKLQSVTF